MLVRLSVRYYSIFIFNFSIISIFLSFGGSFLVLIATTVVLLVICKYAIFFKKKRNILNSVAMEINV